MVGGSAGSSGNGKKVSIGNESDVTTLGTVPVAYLPRVSAVAVVLVAVVPRGLVGNVGIGGAAGAAGNGGDDGSGGTVNVTHTGNITTLGDISAGIFAQSAGGKGFGNAVDISLSGDIFAQGTNSNAILAQSKGINGNGNISVTISGGSMQGGMGTGTGVCFMDGASNTLNNFGTITTLNAITGTAITGTGGGETIHNNGIVTGSVDLGSNSNSFNNKEGATFNTGTTVNLGGGNSLTNAGILSPGGSENILTTVLTGDLAQMSSGTFSWDLNVILRESDCLEVSGTAMLAGLADLNIVNLDVFHNGDTFDVLSAAKIENRFNTVELPPGTALMHWGFDYLQGESSDLFRVDVSVKPFSAVARNGGTA